jgi:hypothetical protein
LGGKAYVIWKLLFTQESHFTSVANEIVPIAPETLQDEIRAKKNNPALYESELFQAPSETDSNGSYKI